MKSRWFQSGRDVGKCKRVQDNVVDSLVTGPPPLTGLATKAVSTKLVHLLTTMGTGVRLAQWCSNSQAHSDSDSIITHSEAMQAKKSEVHATMHRTHWS